MDKVLPLKTWEVYQGLVQGLGETCWKISIRFLHGFFRCYGLRLYPRRASLVHCRGRFIGVALSPRGRL